MFGSPRFRILEGKQRAKPFCRARISRCSCDPCCLRRGRLDGERTASRADDDVVGGGERLINTGDDVVGEPYDRTPSADGNPLGDLERPRGDGRGPACLERRRNRYRYPERSGSGRPSEPPKHRAQEPDRARPGICIGASGNDRYLGPDDLWLRDLQRERGGDAQHVTRVHADVHEPATRDTDLLRRVLQRCRIARPLPEGRGANRCKAALSSHARPTSAASIPAGLTSGRSRPERKRPRRRARTSHFKARAPQSAKVSRVRISRRNRSTSVRAIIRPIRARHRRRIRAQRPLRIRALEARF